MLRNINNLRYADDITLWQKAKKNERRKLWYIYTMEYYSAIKKNTFDSVQMRWMKLEPIIQSEVSQKKKNTVY